MIGAFAVESYVDHLDFQIRLESTGGYIFMQQEINLPVVNGFTRDLNIQSRKKEIQRIAVVFEFNGARFIICIDTVKYGDRWYIRQLGGELSMQLGLYSNYAGIMPVDFLDNPDIDHLILPFT